MSAGHTLDTPGIPGTPETLPGKPQTSAIPEAPSALGIRGFPETLGMSKAQEDPVASEIPWASLRDRARMGIAAVGHGAVFFVLTLAGLGLLLLVLALTLPGPGLVAYGLGQHHNDRGLALALALPALGVSVLLISRLLLVIRRLSQPDQAAGQPLVRRAHCRSVSAAAGG